MNFDLNVNNYKKHELLEMFGLPNNYDKDAVEMRGTILRDNIMNDKNVDKQTQQETTNFLENAMKTLIKDINNGTHQKNTLKKTYLENSTEHMVQQQNQAPYILSYPSEIFRGTINPLSRRTRKENLVIDTRFRENYYNSSPTNFNFQLPMIIENVVEMQLSAIELPTTYYIISKQYNNNFFLLLLMV